MANLVLKAPLFDLNTMPQDAPKVASKRDSVMADLALKAPLFDLNKMPEDVPKTTSKAPLFDLNIMPQDLEKTSKRLRLDVTKHDYQYVKEGGFYKGKIEKLAYRKLNLFACEKKLSEKSKAMPRSQFVTKKVVRVPVVSNDVTERLKEFVTKEMMGSDMKLVIQKFLFGSDLNVVQNRLNIPIKQVLTHDILTADEKRFLENDKKNEIKVRVLGPRLKMYEEPMGLKIWNMEGNRNYVLKGKYWSKFVNDNKDDLQVNTNIQVWSFRKEQQLYLAIVCLDRPAGADGENDVA